MNGQTIIISPHFDDEIIGCYEILKQEDIKTIVIYNDVENSIRKEESRKLRELTNVKYQHYMKNIPTNLISKENTFYFPHPLESHPKHRHYANIGESMLRDGHNVIFYITEMNQIFKHECIDPDGKKELLEKIYPSQKDLWKYDYKYFLFSGYDKWIIMNKEK